MHDPGVSQVVTTEGSLAVTAPPRSNGSEAVVVGRVGTSEDTEQQQPIPSSGRLKRKRQDEGEQSQEPGSSVEPPSSKKRHIRLRQRERVQVSASSSTTPDTQGTSMERAVRQVNFIVVGIC